MVAEIIVANSWHFGVDPDPNPRIYASNLWNRIQSLLFSSLAFKTPTKNFYIVS